MKNNLEEVKGDVTKVSRAEVEGREGEFRSVAVDSAIVAGKGFSETWNQCCERGIWQLTPFANDYTQKTRGLR